MDVATIATSLDWTVAEVRAVCAARSVDPGDLLTMPATKRERARHRTFHPKPDSPGEWAAWRRLALVDEFGVTAEGALLDARASYESLVPSSLLPIAGSVVNGWAELGPGDIGGRIRAILPHPVLPETIWVGSVTGGIWRTDDGGLSWSPVDDFMANLAVTSLVMHPGDPNLLLAATGEGFIGGIRGAGVFRSLDGGVTWNQLPATDTPDFHFVNRIAYDATGTRLYAATDSGVWTSTDDGDTWFSSWTGGNRFSREVDTHPTDPLRAIAHGIDYDFSVSSWVTTALVTTDGGNSWQESNGLRVENFGARIELAYHRGWTGGNGGCIYALQNIAGGTILRSIDGGMNFTEVSAPGVAGNQGWYDLALWVDPTDSDANPNDDFLFVGGIDLWRSTDGGANCTRVSQWWQWPASAHADQHIIVEHPNYDGLLESRIYFGNDGGIYQTTIAPLVEPLVGWTSLNHDLAITQFYDGAGVRPAGPGSEILIGGTQDNGTIEFENGVWTHVFGGDGGYSAIDPADPDLRIGCVQNGWILRSENGGSSFQYIPGHRWNGSEWVWKPLPYKIPDVEIGACNFIAPLALDPNDGNRLYFGGRSLWVTDDLRAPLTIDTGPPWSEVKPPTADAVSISAIAIAAGSPNVVWVGHNDGQLERTTNALATNPTWTRIDDAAGMPGRFLSSITIDPADPDHVLVTFGGYTTGNLWRTLDGGSNWTEITTLPEVPLRAIEVHPADPTWLYAGSEVGVLASVDAGASWSSASSGPALVSVDGLFWIDETLVAVTHGRGFFSKEIPSTQESFRRGDLDGSGTLALSDVIGILLALFQSGSLGSCPDLIDVNDDGSWSISDPITLLQYLFAGGTLPLPGGVTCGADPTPDALGPCVDPACP